MRIFEIFIIITITAMAVNLIFLKRNRFNLILSVLSVLFCIVSMIFEGYRVQMLPAYLLSLVLFLMNVIHSRKGMYHGKKSGRAAGAILLILSLIVAAAFPVLFPVVKLPEPDGEYLVGTMNMSFTDKSRKEIFAASEQYRKIAVQIWYPADDVKGKKTAAMFQNKRMSTYLAQSMQMPDLFGQIALVKTHSYLNAEISDKKSNYPILLFSGGYLGFAGQNTVLMEALASHGYIVFGISHPYEDFASVFPDGELLPYNNHQVSSLQKELINIGKAYAGDTSSAGFEKFQIENAKISNKSIHIWSDDIKFIADEIEKLANGESKSILNNKLNISNMGVFGHSFGGAASGQVCLEDKRFKGFINMDGAPFGDSAKHVIKQPFMIIKGDVHKDLIEAGYFPQQTNYIDVTINGAKHIDFTDFTVLLPAFRYIGALGSIGGDLQEDILKDCVISFFDKYLKGIKEPSINEKLSKYPEVTVEVK